MNLIYFILFSVLTFMSLLLGYKKYHSTTLYALAIGGIVNSLFYHGGTHPIEIFGIPFGIDSIIYTLFIFCVFVMYIKEGSKNAFTLAASSIIAIMISNIFQLIANLLAYGSQTNYWLTFLLFTISSIASLIAVLVMIKFLNKFNNRYNLYLMLVCSILICSIIYSMIYYSLAVLIMGEPTNLIGLLIGSVIGKTIAILTSLFILFIIRKLEEEK